MFPETFPTDVPLFGICFGFQLLARKFLGAPVGKADREYDERTDISARFAGLDGTVVLHAGTKTDACFHHKNAVTLPSDAPDTGAVIVNDATKMLAMDA